MAERQQKIATKATKSFNNNKETTSTKEAAKAARDRKKPLRLDERKQLEMEKKRAHNMMRQISDESSEDARCNGLNGNMDKMSTQQTAFSSSSTNPNPQNQQTQQMKQQQEEKNRKMLEELQRKRQQMLKNASTNRPGNLGSSDGKEAGPGGTSSAIPFAAKNLDSSILFLPTNSQHGNSIIPIFPRIGPEN